MKTPRESVRKRLRRAKAPEKLSLHKAKPEQKLAGESSTVSGHSRHNDKALQILGLGSDRIG